MTNNFFKLLVELESSFLKKYSLLSEEYKDIIRSLIGFVRAGTWAKSDLTKLYCKYYDSSYDEFRQIFVNNGLRDKNYTTFRSQVSEISRNLCEIFGSCDDIYQSFLALSGRESVKNERDGRIFVEDIRLKINALSDGNVDDFMSSLAVNPHDITVIEYTENVYQVGDCEKELVLLKTLSGVAFEELFADIDLDKFAFLLQTLNRPLIETARCEKSGKSGRNYKVNKLFVNTDKVDILKALSVVKPVNLKDYVRYDAGTVSEELPFKFSSTSELSGVVSGRMKSAVLGSDNEKTVRNIASLRRVFSLFTKHGLERYLGNFTDGEISKAVEDYLK